MDGECDAKVTGKLRSAKNTQPRLYTVKPTGHPRNYSSWLPPSSPELTHCAKQCIWIIWWSKQDIGQGTSQDRRGGDLGTMPFSLPLGVPFPSSRESSVDRLLIDFILPLYAYIHIQKSLACSCNINNTRPFTPRSYKLWFPNAPRSSTACALKENLRRDPTPNPTSLR